MWRPFKSRSAACQSSSPAARKRRLWAVALEDRLTPATFTVNNVLSDQDIGSNGFGTLRYCINLANTAPGADTIVFDSSLAGKTVYSNVIGDSVVGPSAYLINSFITISGGANGVTLSPDPVITSARLFRVTNIGNLTLDRVGIDGWKIQGGNGAGGRSGGGGGLGLGGAIYNQGTLTLQNSSITGCIATGGNGGNGIAGQFNGGGAGSINGSGSGTNPGPGGGGAGGQGGTQFNWPGGNGLAMGVGGGGTAEGPAAGYFSGNGGNGAFGAGGGGSILVIAGSGGFGGGNGGRATGFPVTNADAAGGGGGAGLGGAIFNDGGTITLTNSTLTGNTARGGAAGIGVGNVDPAGAGSGIGGALFSRNGSVVMRFCTVSSNTANDGRGVYVVNDGGTPALNVTNSILGQSDNSVTDLVADAGQVNVTGSNNLIRNTSAFGGSANNADPLLGPLTTIGGLPMFATQPLSPAINAGVAISGITTDQRGVARDAKPDIGAYEFNSESTLVTTLADEDDGSSNPGAGAASGTSLREALRYAATKAGADVITFAPALGGQTITLSQGWNGAADDTALRVSDAVTVQGPTGAAGITLAVATGDQRRHFLVGGGSLTLENLTLTGGKLSVEGGSVWSNALLTVRGCTFTANSSGTSGGAIFSASGATSLVVENSTLANNAGTAGSAIFTGATQNTFNFLTVADNVAPVGGSAIWLHNASVTMSNSIIVRNTNDGVGVAGTGGFSAQSKNNLVGAGSWAGLVNGQNGNLVGVASPGLGTLGANGGPTQTIPILATSPAVNGGVVISGITTDQRGRQRDSKPDIGAYELPLESLVVTTLADEDDGQSNPFLGAGTSLREAMNYANARAGADTITFATGLSGTITLNGTQLPVMSEAVTIAGPGAGLLTVSGNNKSRVFEIGATVASTISGMTITGGKTAYVSYYVDTRGAGILNNGTLTISNCIVTGNSADARGGGIYSEGTLSVINCTLSGNTSGDGGGGIYSVGTCLVSGSTVTANVINDAYGSGFGAGIGHFAPYSTDSLTITDTIISGNSGARYGGGLYMDGGTGNVTNSLITGNSAENGGGIYKDDGTLTVTNSTISGNTATDDGGGIYAWDDLTNLVSSAVINNKSGNRGGGVYVGTRGTFNAVNSTISGNSADRGGGLFTGYYVYPPYPAYIGVATLTNVTVSGNRATTDGGGATNLGKLTAVNTIIAGNSAPASADLLGTLEAASSNNLVSLSAAAAGLGTLGSHGGPTLSVRLLAGSPAIDAGVAVSGVTTDQRGVARPQGTKFDIGAFEYTGTAPSLVVTTAADENDNTSDPALGTGTSLREALAYAQTTTTYTGFTQSGVGVSLNKSGGGGGPTVALGASSLQDTLTITDGQTGNGNSAWLGQKINVNNFSVSFRYAQDAGANGGDGFTFSLQNAGPNAVGAGGGGLGYSGIASSVAIAFNIYNAGGALVQGFGTRVGGVGGGQYTLPGNGVSLVNGQPVDITITGNGPDVTLTMKQGSNTFTTTFSGLNIASNVGGNSAYAGFTGGSGAAVATQTITNFSLTSGPQPATITFAPGLYSQTISLNQGWSGAADASSLVVSGPVTIQGPSTGPSVTLAVAAGAQRRHFYVQPSASLTLANLALTGGDVSARADTWGGAVWNFGSLTVRGSTFTGNKAGEGGAIQSWGDSPSLVIENSTIAGNTAVFNAGGVMSGSVTTQLANVTIVDNVSGPGGAAFAQFKHPALLANSIIARNTAGAVAADAIGLSGGTFAAASHNNLIGTGGAINLVNGQNNNQVGVANPFLGTLGDYGGPVLSVPLLPGSPAIDAGSSTITADQRGKSRVGAADIGAFESQGFTLTPSGSGQSAPINAPFANPLKVVVTSTNPVEPVNGGVVTFAAPGSGASATLSGGTATIAAGQASVTATANGTLGNYNVTASAAGALPAQFSLTNVASAPAKVAAVAINGGATQRSVVTSLKVSFDRPVTVADWSQALQLERQTGSASVTLGFDPDPAGLFVNVTFTGGSVDGKSLADGRYTLTAVASAFGGDGLDGNGDGTAGDNYVLSSAAAPAAPTNIFRLFGDVNGDGFTDIVDFVLFRQANGSDSTMVNYNPAFDVNGDGFIDNVDFIAFRQRLGATV